MKKRSKALLAGHIQDMANWYYTSNVEALARHFAVPLITYMYDDIVVVDRVEEIKALTLAACSLFQSSSVQNIDVSLFEHKDFGNGRHSVKLTWQLFHQDSSCDFALTGRFMFAISARDDFITLEICEVLEGAENYLETEIHALYTRQRAERQANSS